MWWRDMRTNRLLKEVMILAIHWEINGKISISPIDVHCIELQKSAIVMTYEKRELIRLFLKVLLIEFLDSHVVTARKRSFGQGIVFTRFCPRGVCMMPLPVRLPGPLFLLGGLPGSMFFPEVCLCLVPCSFQGGVKGDRDPPPPKYWHQVVATEADGIHPTGKHSYCIQKSLGSVSIYDVFSWEKGEPKKLHMPR